MNGFLKPKARLFKEPLAFKQGAIVLLERKLARDSPEMFKKLTS